jgi:hypothetical protein
MLDPISFKSGKQSLNGKKSLRPLGFKSPGACSIKPFSDVINFPFRIALALPQNIRVEVTNTLACYGQLCPQKSPKQRGLQAWRHVI